MLKTAGLVLLMLGLAAGVVLVLAPLGMLGASGAVAPWVLFPLASASGLVLTFLGGSTSSGLAASRALGAGLVTLALVAAVALLLTGAGFWTPAASTLSLWYV
ncbi:MAG: hypothetical protein ACREQQ_09700, partial [Candidatus Binatia bacterium]